MADKKPNPDLRTEQRKEPRESCQVAVLVCNDTDGRAFEPAQMINRSSHGVAIIFSRPIQPGQRFLLKSREQVLTVSAYVARHCQPIDQANYLIGGQLLQVVGEHAV